MQVLFFGSAFIKEYKVVEISCTEYMCFKEIILEIGKKPLHLISDLRQGAQDGALSHMFQAARINSKICVAADNCRLRARPFVTLIDSCARASLCEGWSS